jgi:hypothetical protein
MGQGGDVPGGPYQSIECCGDLLGGNRALNRIIATLADQAKPITIKVQQAHQGSAQAPQYVVGIDSIIVPLDTGERNSVSQIVGINAQLF